MSGDRFGGVLTAIAILLLGVIFGLKIGVHASQMYWHAEALKRGYAENSTETGRWQWKESEAQR